MTDAEIKALLHELCDVAARETLPRFRQRLSIDNKEADGFDPVTEADREAERAIRDVLAMRRPDDSIIGEEFDPVEGSSDYTWILDPVDGTRAFISGLPVWGTLIGLYDDRRPIAGAMDQPFTGDRHIATGGKSLLQDRFGTKIENQVSNVTTLAEAILMTTSPHLLNGTRYENVEQKVKLFRYGCDCTAYGLLAAGHVDLVIENGLNIYDIAALIPIMKMAGATVTAWDGGDPSQGGSVLAAASETVHNEAMAVLNG
ncbi:histidinol-phosphatase [Ahrensia sp. R2A130]|uniref:histidinol-phosphatase n=1 Tax=Ahrensia sp. R2A130 TaxID=744979 RepID=UPI0001E0C379|nr:histidinol-phosphatase [Ahrensia sp. R2A130]EFL88795.1 inositol monophosphatase family protein [Ahrensia sp. R2A130]